MWGFGRWFGPWPGRGPFSYLPPWLRPGWLFGRGACWWLFGAPFWGRWFWATPWFTPAFYWYWPRFWW
ncbi:MAG: hypothetical protein DRJ68_02715 [Thermoprotei archaeon]|nr:MAG: hypothetical protein DRJ68_02715 [Thermoprotei archaeon]